MAERPLAERYVELRRSLPQLRARDAAQRLGATEAALVGSGVTGPATPLRPDWAALIVACRSLGPVMALTRNEHAVHERHGRFEEISSGPGHILVLGPDIDLRLFPGGWAHAFAVGGPRPSLQIFDKAGEAAHKIFALEGRTDLRAWDALVASFAAPALPPPPERATPRAAPEAEGAVDAAALRTDWLALRDTHDFVKLLRQHRASRRQALALAGDDLSRPLDPAAAGRATLTLAAEQQVPIMVFVGNRSAIQIHTGLIRRLLPSSGGWFNVLDPDFNLHLREAGVASAWRVVKPTEDGAVTSIELLDAAGGVLAQLFGARKPGQKEREDWRAIAAEVAERHAATAEAAA
uniref:hemin-degrading factor n=1 Tax=Siccirubricoccus phaeus TaxID=2595053 RepID=UPI0011F1CCED